MRTQTETAHEDIAAAAKKLLESLKHPALARFLTDWPRTYSRRGTAPAHLPVLQWLPQIDGNTTAFTAELATALCRTAPSLAWRQTYAAKDLDRAFLDNYGWSEIVGTVGPLQSEQIACGFLILGPSTHYPRHRHPAEEIYVPLSGTAAWQQSDAMWRERPPGTPIHHRSEEPHAMRTGADPLLALYVWRGADLEQKATLDSVGW
ncbi:MAG: dimethylsulfonioproprionate lyase family protein [Gammaproteobacteria bacterium]